MRILENYSINRKQKNDAIKNEVINLLKCYRGDEDAKMKNFSFEHYIEIIIDMFDKWDLKGSEENG